MQLHEFKQKNKIRKMRIGRGGKRGTTSGRGTKGQKSRSGRVIRPAQRDLILRIPKKRGFRNKPFSEKARAVSLSELSAIQGPITAESIARAGLSRRGQRVKILGNGTITKPVEVRGVSVSESAKLKIEKAGGSVRA
ncbi:MAG: 50S ribosomal protein L15 [Parcubacteria group bacterium GW2011_GWA1_50_14]|uniref:Large ribosomal subunit protein uL15 n=1 Tax=Candidatus Liptonbacteria bacterium GWB1_49_6 TaxID=1798644 RepID=A0A1G2C715_9BACT|nr:MAG: 50S ribosomal protein L15 [Parcubacteria group bacterium GW2011_GWA1_50_14]OGY96931.1 MAG: hypothetical protein A2122_01080 [Candidatus Liptonbacteria bacterium GWB1_49_6]